MALALQMKVKLLLSVVEPLKKKREHGTVMAALVTTPVTILIGQLMQELICSHQRKFLSIKPRRQKAVQMKKKNLKNRSKNRLKRKRKK
ncbi:pleckstrin homology domain interacting protein [Phyllostomus discolor]|uniref:Pleckstrin homology domain interacting protein n=1 Tax=Phyllostomus discolor TaxID=89673 RepID=A0A834EFW0_9CHIR|nr:pleckstrin homology domain interacting protein [Phyllostomus discolor]